MNGAQLAEAFNTANARKNWKARAVSHKNRDVVHFEDRAGLIHLQYDTTTGQFLVTFAKAVASFGDYTNAIARGLLTVLSSLQAGGAPFVAPQGLEGMEIVIKHGGIGNVVSVRCATPAIYAEFDPTRHVLAEPDALAGYDPSELNRQFAQPHFGHDDGSELL